MSKLVEQLETLAAEAIAEAKAHPFRTAVYVVALLYVAKLLKRHVWDS